MDIPRRPAHSLLLRSTALRLCLSAALRVLYARAASARACPRVDAMGILSRWRLLLPLAELLLAVMAAGGDAVEVPVCLMVPLLGPPPAEGSAIPNPSGLHLLRGLLRAVHHVNSADCSVLGEGCSELLHYGASGRRLRLRPYLFNIESGVPQSAPKSALSCAATDAEVIVGPLTSEESSTIASFVGGLGTSRSVFQDGRHS